ncbi:glycerophosphoryl diester phosphodiesterase [Gemmobacter caeni]|uniref:Glycerophosphoryl diester phosphodiesterase n=1 Tax=Gemmobacter caeni TaxID=589035 RepID=A0A2T6APT8_9RHOB|nr:glycerophosphodiester phosphodiesterase family protein [Gemmobacter caeni]PTX45790.1 glycerophosphoryl diester phosphodiesterase [Gemmobacter caeni]TWI94095.1 glycerophosphoryl diester phosphodiesterase [Gemmobacter caeni]
MTRIPLPTAFLHQPVAHRALHDRAAGRPENSLAAIRAAMDAGYAIEIDLQLSSDGVAMVFHDEDLPRLTGRSGWAADHTAAELGAMTLLGTDETVPTLAGVLALVAGKVPLLIEIKDQLLSPIGRIGPLEQATAAALAGYDGPVALMSFNPDSVAEMARLCPDLPRGLTTGSYDPVSYAPLSPALCDRLREIPDYDRTGAGFISHEAADLPRPRVAELKAQGAAILCWTIRSPEAEATARKIADNITFEGYLAAKA